MDAPTDFSAWMEVYLSGRWYSFDARHNQPRTGRIVIARGRDAADVPSTMVFANHRLEKFSVVTEEITMNGKYQPAVERAESGLVVDNAAIAELLASEAERVAGQLQRAFRNAARKALLWPQ